MSPKPERHRPAAVSPLAQTLKPETEQLKVGNGTASPEQAPAKPPAKAKTRTPFGSYLDPALQRQFKARCVLLGIEMQDGLEDAITAWLKEHPAT